MTSVPASDLYHHFPCCDINPEVGITGTPVIDPSSGTLYVVAMTKENGNYVQRLHALNIAYGSEQAGSPVTITAAVQGNGAGSSNGVISFDATTQNQRSGLLLLHGIVYVPWGAFGDSPPYHGWIIGYNATTLQPTYVYNDTPNGAGAGIWQAGASLAADLADGSIYFQTGNGDFNLASGGTEGGDTMLKLSSDLKQRLDYFTPFNQVCLDDVDVDLGSGGPLVVPDQLDGNHSSLLVGGGKEGRLYVMDRTTMGKFTALDNACSNQARTDVDKVVQEFAPITPGAARGGIFSNPAYWNGSSGQYVYVQQIQDHLKAYSLVNGLLSTTPTSQTPESFTYPGGNPVISSNGTTPGTGIVWVIAPPPGNCSTADDHCNPTGPGSLRAYDATNLNTELYSSQNVRGDALSTPTKFSIPTIANGEVLVATSNTLDIYGLK